MADRDQRGALDYLCLDDQTLLGQCDVHRARGSGPGGQKRNKTESAVRLRHRPTGLTAQSDDSRSQHLNRDTALLRLRRRLALELRHPLDLPSYRPSAGLLQLVQEKGHVAGRRSGADLPALAELLDLFQALGCSVRDTAARLGSSSGGLSRLLLLDRQVGEAVNRLRAEHGLRPLR